jgi:hypothetical protein
VTATVRTLDAVRTILHTTDSQAGTLTVCSIYALLRGAPKGLPHRPGGPIGVRSRGTSAKKPLVFPTIARLQAPPIAEATEERRLLAVAGKPWLGGDWPRLGPGMLLPQGLAGAAHADEEVRTLAVAKR